MLPIARWAGLSLTAVLLSTAFAWGTPPVASPAATPPVRAAAARSLTLDPPEGPPGSTVGVGGHGFENCTRSGLVAEPRPPNEPDEPAEPAEIRVFWERGGGGPSTVTADADGEFETEVTVPSDAVPGSRDVIALCTVNSKVRATADFQVTPAPRPTTLALDPAEGAAGTSVTVSGSGFDGCTADDGQAGGIALTWDDGPLPGVTPEEITVDAGAFTVGFTVPPDADAADHAVTATCAEDARVSAEQSFTVTSVPETRPAVRLEPSSMRAGGGSVNLSGSGFDCPEVALSWAGEPLKTLAPAEDGTFETRFDVAPDAAEDSYTVRAACTDDPGTGADAAFTVTGEGPVPPSPTPPTPTPPTPTPPTPVPPTPTPTPDPATDTVPVGLVVGSGLLGAALLALAGFAFLSRLHRGPRWVRDHVSSRPRPAPGATDVAEPSGTGPPTRSVRLEPHPDPGEQTLKEEDP